LELRNPWAYRLLIREEREEGYLSLSSLECQYRMAPLIVIGKSSNIIWVANLTYKLILKRKTSSVLDPLRNGGKTMQFIPYHYL